VASRPTLRRPSSYLIPSLLLLTIGGVLAPPASAVQTPHPSVVSDNPANWMPNILDGQVNAKELGGGITTRSFVRPPAGRRIPTSLRKVDLRP
jgi:hypothetical protein